VIRRALLAIGAAALSIVSLEFLSRRAAARLMDRPRAVAEEGALQPQLDALGGEVVRIRSRDGLRLSARWLEPEADGSRWSPDPHEAILLLHGGTGSSVPHLVEHGPYLRRTAGVLALDFRGHGDSDASPTTFGLREVEDVAGALAWFGERGIERVALMGFSMGAMTAISAVAVLGDGSPVGTDVDPTRPAHVSAPNQPRIVAVIADSTVPQVEGVAASFPGLNRFMAARIFDSMAKMLGGDARETEPLRVIGLLEGVDILLISGDRDEIVPVPDAQRLADAAPKGTAHWVVPGAQHRKGHSVDPNGYESRVTAHMRAAFRRGREPDL
jgi:pimeloyl-ACP methyl ester carboxylesterase